MTLYSAAKQLSELTTDISGALSVLFERHKEEPRSETEWIERVLDAKDPSDTDIVHEIRVAASMHCPNLPDESMEYLVGILLAKVRGLREKRRAGLQQTGARKAKRGLG